MQYLLIEGARQSELIAALETGYEAWKIQDAERTKELAEKGTVVCYSSLHNLYEMPLAAIRNAERVSFVDGVMGPPPEDEASEYFFLLGGNYLPDLPRRLARDGFAPLGCCITNARKVTLPETHCFIDATGYEFEIIGWNEADAQRRVEADSRVKLPVRWFCSWSAFPFMGAVYRGKAESWDDPEPYYQPDGELEKGAPVPASMDLEK